MWMESTQKSSDRCDAAVEQRHKKEEDVFHFLLSYFIRLLLGDPALMETWSSDLDPALEGGGTRRQRIQSFIVS